ncbi:serine protease persephone-like [Malaya genurostris]|uniref:serine protease persephone-like n=1 Tax=Malaya genurostris TaxID=325434 RepID=UPI0026F3C89E|nr:serine protease persephone-like [Malaya genurostris]
MLLQSIAVQLVWFGLILAVPLNDRYEGDRCKLVDGSSDGICRHHSACPYLKTVPNKDWVTCSFDKDQPIVCCREEQAVPFRTVTQVRVAAKSELKCAGFSESSDINEHIWNGVEAAPDEFPHVAALGYPAKNEETLFRCGASLISSQYLLTAAHCLIPERPTFARLGVTHLFEYNENDPPVDVAIKNVVIHPKYTARPLTNDIALLELNRTINEAFLIPACLYTNATDPPTNVSLSIEGWGSTDPNDIGISPVLLKANVTSLDRGACNDTLSKDKSRRSAGELQNTQLCALGRNAQNETVGDTCVGDSGGPLELIQARRRYIVGVTSNGKLCGSSWPGIYTRVSHYLDWIESIVWPG